jgi:fido (protein-threonine AMPylation protein)
VEFEYAPGATPLDPDEAAGLVPKHITNQGELNAWEQANIFQANRWAIRQAKRDLLDNTCYQIEHAVFGPQEVAVRFHHQLVWIHAFANGNGRHARLMADLLAIRLGAGRLTWGGASAALTSVGDVRVRYLAALRAADQGHYTDLMTFASS